VDRVKVGGNLLREEFYLTNTSLLSGNEIGHLRNGYALIKLILNVTVKDEHGKFSFNEYETYTTIINQLYQNLC
jgi:hypothetical protein